ncbi:MAG: hypothetical protein ACTSWD_00040 [Candidatus Heimdallarchaeota archaeon]
MKKNKLTKIMINHYWKNSTKFKLTTRYDTDAMIEQGSYNEQEIEYKDYTFCLIRNYESVKYHEDYATRPYCIKSDIFGYIITVPTFKQLTNKDIAKAIYYIFRQMDDFMFFTVSLDDKWVQHISKPNYQCDTSTLRWLTQYKGEK